MKFNRVLVTVRNKKLWGCEQDNKIFLGEWCLKYGEEESLSNQNFEFVRYFWDDRKLYAKDYYHTLEIYEKTLDEVSSRLNKIHNTNYSKRYWRIVVGIWLGTFIQVLYERWSNLEVAFKENNPDLVYIQKYKEVDFIPFDNPEFGVFVNNDPWNEFIFSEILKRIFRKKIRFLELDSYCEINLDSPKSLKKESLLFGAIGKLKRNILTIYNLLASYFSKKSDFFFFDTLVPRIFEYKVQLFLGQIPVINKANLNKVKKNINPSLRINPINIDCDNANSEFLKLLSEMIFLNMPSCYLENYSDISKFCEEINWPNKPKVIFTAMINKNEVFKQWAAKKIEDGSKLYIRQHGGSYGISPFIFHMDHEYNIADKWFSWGWTDPLRNKIVASYNTKWGGVQNIKKSYKDEIFMHLHVRTRYTQHMLCSPMAGQYNKYFSDQEVFIDNLSQEVYKKLVVQPMWIDHGRRQIKRLTSKFPDLNISTEYIPTNKKASSIALYVGTYNGTGMLEFLNFDVPSVFFWDLNLYEISDSAFTYFQDLIDVGIFHKTPESAAKHLSNIHNDILGWWAKPNVVNAKNKFCNNYSRKSDALSYARILKNKKSSI